jgi:uncharacterized membrane protein
VKAVDRRALVLNLLFLRVIALIPFPTALLAEYLRQPGWSGHLAALVFAGLMTAMAVLFCAVWLHIWRRSWSTRVSSSSTSQNASRFSRRQQQVTRPRGGLTPSPACTRALAGR